MKIWTAMFAAILLVADVSAQKPKTTVYLAVLTIAQHVAQVEAVYQLAVSR